MKMKIKVRVKPNSSRQEIEDFGDGNYLVYLKSPAEDNRANIELINLLSKHLCVPVRRIKLKFGKTGRDKVLEVF